MSYGAALWECLRKFCILCYTRVSFQREDRP